MQSLWLSVEVTSLCRVVVTPSRVFAKIFRGRGYLFFLGGGGGCGTLYKSKMLALI